MLSISILWLLWCTKTPKIEEWDTVTISYTWTFENWQLFEINKKTIKIGSWEIIKWIEKAILGKKVWKTIKASVSPEEWYGNEYSIYNQQRIPLFILEKLWLPTETWTIITLDKTTWKILKQEQDEKWNTIIILDINPIQTRQDLWYEINIENIEKNWITYTL